MSWPAPLYGLAGVFISAQTGSGDPLVGNPMLLQMFASVVLGGTLLGGGRGGPVGTIFGAYVLLMVVNILLVLNVPAFYSSIVEGSILILAVLGSSFTRSSVLSMTLRTIARRFQARRAGTLPGRLSLKERRLQLPMVRPAITQPSFWVRWQETLRTALPAFICFAAGRDRHPAGAGQCRILLDLLQFASRARMLPGDPGARPGHRDPHRRA